MRAPNDWPIDRVGQSRSYPPPNFPPSRLITSFGPVTSGTIASPLLVLHSTHEENCNCRAIAGVVRRPRLWRLAFPQKAT
jgi:hypothetical protein